MSTSRRYPPEIRERAVRLVFEHEQDYPSQWSAIRSIAEKSGMTAETLRKWVRAAERDSGRRDGITTDDRQRMRDLEREVKELRRANEILKAASSFMRTPRLCGTGAARSVVVAARRGWRPLIQSA